MAYNRFMGLQQEKFQDIQNFRDQYLALCKVCTELGLSFGRSESDAKAVLATRGSEKIKKGATARGTRLSGRRASHHNFYINLTNQNMES